MKGSIRFDNEINVEVAVDPSQDERAKLLSAVNLVDGQELSPGGGGGGGSSVLFLKEDENRSIGVSYNDLKDALDDNILPVLKYDSEGTYGVFYLATIFHNEGENYGADFGGDMYVADTPTDPLVFSE